MPRPPRQRKPCRLCGEPALSWRIYCSHECATRARLGRNSARAWRVAAAIREGKLIEDALTDLERKTTVETSTTNGKEKDNGN